MLWEKKILDKSRSAVIPLASQTYLLFKTESFAAHIFTYEKSTVAHQRIESSFTINSHTIDRPSYLRLLAMMTDDSRQDITQIRAIG